MKQDVAHFVQLYFMYYMAKGGKQNTSLYEDVSMDLVLGFSKI